MPIDPPMDIELPEASKKTRRSQIISTVVSPAVRLWLRSQVEQVERLEFKLVGGDRQILTGDIPSVSIAASHAVYQGLHLSEIQLEGRDIRFNLGQVFKGKPLRLLAPIPVVGQLWLTESDLQASLESSLLSNALRELVETLLKSGDRPNQTDSLKDREIHWQKINIDTDQLTLTGVITNPATLPIPIGIRAGLGLASHQELQLNPLQIELDPDQPPIHLDGFRIDLGSEVDIQELSLIPGRLICRGRLTVIP